MDNRQQLQNLEQLIKEFEEKLDRLEELVDDLEDYVEAQDKPADSEGTGGESHSEGTKSEEDPPLHQLDIESDGVSEESLSSPEDGSPPHESVPLPRKSSGFQLAKAGGPPGQI